MLFTVLNRETRFKAKPVIDVVIYRGGDVLTAWLFTLLADKLGLGLSGIAVVIGGVALAWVYVAVRLGREYQDRTLESSMNAA
jgi:AAA family ATP:ADP antiporter